MNWNDPQARLALLERVGVRQYNTMMTQYKLANPIRLVSTRFGPLHYVDATQKAWYTRTEAEADLKQHLEKETVDNELDDDSDDPTSVFYTGQRKDQEAVDRALRGRTK